MDWLLNLFKSAYQFIGSCLGKIVDFVILAFQKVSIEVSAIDLIGTIKSTFLKKSKEAHIINIQKSADNFVHYITNNELSNVEVFETEEELTITASKIKYRKRTKGNRHNM